MAETYDVLTSTGEIGGALVVDDHGIATFEVPGAAPQVWPVAEVVRLIEAVGGSVPGWPPDPG